MVDNWATTESKRTLKRLLPRIEPILEGSKDKKIFLKRLDEHFPDAFRLLHMLYGDQYDFFYYLEQILATLAETFVARSAALKKLDKQREKEPLWFMSEDMVGGVCYIDRFADNLKGIQKNIPYFKELGLTYLHLMPFFKGPEDDSDGGYAISDYRSVNPELGTMKDVEKLAAELRKNGISLVVDFVFNHTADNHTWAQKAREGDEEHARFYFMFDDRTEPDAYERTLREIFPEQDPGSFTYQPDIKKWVWTTFRHFQWDLNYRNPAVFNAMLGELLFLANQGVEVLRLDAVAFTWKQKGTGCENLPQAHWLIKAFNALVKIATPAMIFKSEAIVHPAQVAEYISWEECPISYNPTLMALLWESIATRETKLLRHSMYRRFDIPEQCAWVNYVRVHDDIGWTFADEDAWEVGINGYDHRQFLNKFYTGSFPGSFAKGVPFNYNPVNHDMRICGMAASLAGLEQGIEYENELYIENAIKRLLLIHSVIISAGGIPLIYLGDEIATMNDYSYEQHPDHKDDTRWVHRPKFDWVRAEKRNDTSTYAGQVFTGLKKLIQLRKSTPAFRTGKTDFFDCDNGHVLSYLVNEDVLVLANFADRETTIWRDRLLPVADLPAENTDLITGKTITIDETFTLQPYEFIWLKYEKAVKKPTPPQTV